MDSVSEYLFDIMIHTWSDIMIHVRIPYLNTCSKSMVMLISLYFIPRENGGLCHQRTVPSTIFSGGWLMSGLLASQYWQFWPPWKKCILISFFVLKICKWKMKQKFQKFQSLTKRLASTKRILYDDKSDIMITQIIATPQFYTVPLCTVDPKK